MAGGLAFAAAPSLSNAQTEKPEEKRPLSGKTALITGAARGIGAAIAEKLASQGANIVLIDIANPDALKGKLTYKLSSPADLEQTAEKVRAHNVKTLSIIADIRDKSAMLSAVKKTISDMGTLDFVIANAGIGSSGGYFEHEDESVLSLLLDINVKGTANTIHAAIPYLKGKKDGGRIIAITSVSSRQGMASIASYAASKWAVTGLIKSLCLELGHYNITTNCIAPTGVKTTMLLGNQENGLFSTAKAAAGNAYVQSQHSLPIGLLEPQDIANAVAFLCSHEAQYISGTTIDVNAGWSGKLTA